MRRLFVCGVGADAAVRGLGRHEVLYRAFDHRGEFGVAQIVIGEDRRADDLAPEFAAPRAVVLVAEPERLDELVVVDLLQTLFRGAPERFAQYAENIWGATVGTTEEKARAGVRETEEFWRGLGLPLCFTELGIGELSEDAIEALADSCTDGGKKTVGAFRPIDRETALSIYRRANR